jgi:hypothetical protein
MGKADSIISLHILYQQPGAGPVERQAVYRGLFKEKDLQALRKCTNDSTIVGSDKFQADIATMLARSVKKYEHGGDRRTKRDK